jgi:hypothetical protein
VVPNHQSIVKRAKLLNGDGQHVRASRGGVVSLGSGAAKSGHERDKARRFDKVAPPATYDRADAAG